MNLSFKQVNVLPTRTWRWLNVNDTSLSAEIPEPRPYPAALPEAPEGVSIVPAGEAENVPEMETGMGKPAQAFVAAHRSGGAFIRVSAGTHAEQPLLFRYRLDEANPSLADENTIIAEAGSKITVVMNYCSQETVSGFHGGVTRIVAEKGAVVRLIQLQMLSDRCPHFDDIGAVAGENAQIFIVQAELGAKRALAGCKVRLEGKESALNMESIYFGDGDRTVDLNYVAEHIGRRTQSEIHVNGALLDQSEKTFRGTIDFIKGSAGAVGHESEYTLLFSPTARSRTAPLILCGEENVEGQHAASTGKIDENKLFYLMTRGLDELSAKKLIIEAQFAPATEQIPDADLKSAISNYVRERLNRIEPVS